MNPKLPSIRPHILQMPGYEPVQPVARLAEQFNLDSASIIKVDANENPYAPFDFVREALAGLADSNRYPDPEGCTLRAALADYLNVPAENLLAGAGADDLIDLLMRLFVEAGDTVINCPPTFGMYSFDADIQHARVVNVPRRADFSVDVAAVEQAVAENQPRLLFITSPNNPDGSLLARADLERLLRLPVVLVLDEAYVEFAPPGTSAIREVAKRDNLVVLRTFSKWAGLAGLRVGYGAFPLWMMEQLWKIKQPYNLSAAAEAAGVASIRNAAELNRVADLLIAERERLYTGLKEFGWLTIYPSQSNFILCRVSGRDARQTKLDLARQGVMVRYFSKPGLNDCIRISVGRPADTDRILQALRAI
jgi:histidinol-phosphate aminotransferase